MLGGVIMSYDRKVYTEANVLCYNTILSDFVFTKRYFYTVGYNKHIWDYYYLFLCGQIRRMKVYE